MVPLLLSDWVGGQRITENRKDMSLGMADLALRHTNPCCAERLPICRRLSRRLVQAKLADLVGDDVVIAVDIYCQGPRYPSSSAVSMWLRVSQAQSCLLSRAEAASADVLIAPAIAPAGVEGAKGRETARRLGYEAALAALPALRAALRHHGVVPGVTPVGPATSSVQQRLRGTKSSSVTQDRLSTRLQRS